MSESDDEHGDIFSEVKYGWVMDEKTMGADFHADIKVIVEEASKQISKEAKISDLPERLRDRIHGARPVLRGQLVDRNVFALPYTKEEISRIFQLFFIPKAEEIVRELLVENFPDLHKDNDADDEGDSSEK